MLSKIKKMVIGDDRDINDPAIFHKLSLMAFFAWIGLGTDGISSSCYGPEEAFRIVTSHPHLAIFVAIATTATIFIISASYNQIIELFPSGGGGYIVASKLLSPTLGMISGCALLVDYVLTISLSVSSGVDALFSFLPNSLQGYKLTAALAGIFLLIVINLRGVKESVMPLVPVFLLFIITHVFAFVYTLTIHTMDISSLVVETQSGVTSAFTELGLLGLFALIMKAYSMGAGTFTGIEAVSNGLPILREPRIETAKKTMTYMSFSLSITALGLMLGYIFYQVTPSVDLSKTLNAIYFEKMTANWPVHTGQVFVWVTLLSEATLLFVAAQTGFLDGPRVLANMAIDRWFPTRFSMLSNRLVTQNGIILMGLAALVTVLISHGNVRMLVVLYSINVFITFVLSQLGMLRHWWTARTNTDHWRKKLILNGIGLVLTLAILLSVVVLKFHEGGWVTFFVTGSLILTVVLVKKHYTQAGELVKRLNLLVSATTEEVFPKNSEKAISADPNSKTAVILVNGFNGIGLHTLMNVIRIFGNTFQNFIFVQIGVVDAGTFKGTKEMELLQSHTASEVKRYVEYMQRHGYFSESYTALGNDVVKEVFKLVPRIREKYPNATFFGGQLVFPEESFLNKWLHNYITFALQRKFFVEGIPFIIMPIRI